MNLGFIGTGQIAKATITGILKSKLKIHRIYISRRNKKISSQLSKKNKKIIILEDNQKIIDKSNWVFLSVTPEVGNRILKNLSFKTRQTIISFISTIKMKELNNLKCLIIDCLKFEKHPSHFNLEESLYIHRHLKPKKTILTNLHHDLDYNYLLKKLPRDVVPAYDGLKISL